MLVVLTLSLILLCVWLVPNFSSVRSASVHYLPSLLPLKQEPARVSQLHYLIPSNIVNGAVCAGVVSALVNRYPIPVFVGYKGENEFDLTVHSAKLRVINRYLTNLDAEDDDLMILVDSFDIVAQVPVEVMIQRYFDIQAKSEQRLADQRGITTEQLHELGIRQTVLYGAGKMCFTGVPNAELCPFMPASNMAHYSFAAFEKEYTTRNDVRFLDPRYLNSGSIIAPVGDLRKLVPAVLELIEADSENVYNDSHYRQLHNMDQWHTATLYVRQEYQRALDMNNGVYPEDLSNVTILPKPKSGADDTTEYHIFVDFESEFTQTHCRNQLEMHNLQYNNSDLTATVKEDFLEEGGGFRPHKIQMPANLYQAFGRVWERLSGLADVSLAGSQREWIQDLRLGTNVASDKIYSFYHNTCNKTLFLDRYHGFWFEPFIVPLLQIARNGLRDNNPLHTEPIDGRTWVAAQPYTVPQKRKRNEKDDIGGVFTDYGPMQYIGLQDMCAENLTQILGLKVTDL